MIFIRMDTKLMALPTEFSFEFFHLAHIHICITNAVDLEHVLRTRC